MLRDILYALRALRHSTAFAVTVILTLGLGLGLNTTLFTLFNTYVLRPFAVTDPYSLYGVRWQTTKSTRPAVTWDQYLELRTKTDIFTDTLACSPILARLEARNLVGMAVSGNYFTALGVGVTLGRPILPEDVAAAGTGAYVVISHRLWQADFGEDAGLIGRSIHIGGKSLEVVSIAPKDFEGVAEFPVDFYVPLSMQSAIVPGPDVYGPGKPAGVIPIGRLKPGVSVAQAQSALTLWLRNSTRKLPEDERALGATLVSRATPVSLEPEVMAIFLPLIVVFGLVLLICCANVSNMMLARAVGRQREIGVRLAIGASRSRLIRQLLTENLLLSLMAGAVGFVVSLLTIRGAQRIMILTIPPSLNLVHAPALSPDFRMFFFVLGAASLTTIVCGLAPALQATRTSLTEALRGEFGGRISASRLRSVLVVSQISVCLILLVLTGILLRGSDKYKQMDPGYQPHGVAYPLFIGRSDANGSGKLSQELVNAPWIDQLAAAARPPLRNTVQVAMRTPHGNQTIRAAYNLVSPEYFRLLGIPIVKGRAFHQEEGDSEASVAIISHATAQKFWPDADAIGQSLIFDLKNFPANEAPRTAEAVVIGITKDITSGSMMAGVDPTMVYFPTSVHSQRPLTFLIRGKGTLSATSHELEKAVNTAVPDRPVLSTTLDDMLVTQLYPFRAAAWLAAMLGVLALLLTLSGMYGVLSYLVGQRTKEIGIRIALGATPSLVVRLILRQSFRFAAWGVGVGTVLAVSGSLIMRHFLTVIDAFDTFSYGSAIGMVCLAAAAAALFPSSRASRINPIETLRAD